MRYTGIIMIDVTQQYNRCATVQILCVCITLQYLTKTFAQFTVSAERTN